MKNSDLKFWDSKVLKALYDGAGAENNCRIIYNEKAKSGKCIIFFSSNGLYFPNDDAVVIKTIKEKDKYDWANLSRHKKIVLSFEKIIFLRDIYKQWYITGINSQVDSVEKLVVFLRRETNNFSVYTAGSSAGGYAAAVFGVLLNAKAAYCFSAQFRIWDQIDKAPFINKYQYDIGRSKYFDIRNYIENSENTLIFYFYPAYCEWDIQQYKLIADCSKVIPFAFDSDIHGATMMRANIPYILTMNPEKLKLFGEKYKSFIFKEAQFLFKSLGLLLGVNVLTQRLFRKFLNIILVWYKKVDNLFSRIS